MKAEDLTEFEHRLLGLVREWLAKERDGSKVGHFGVIYDVVDPDDETKPATATPPGFPPGEGGIAFSFSTGSDWIQEALLREALEAVQGRRYARDDDEDESEDEDD